MLMLNGIACIFTIPEIVNFRKIKERVLALEENYFRSRNILKSEY